MTYTEMTENCYIVSRRRLGQILLIMDQELVKVREEEEFREYQYCAIPAPSVTNSSDRIIFTGRYIR
jgi:hypothetical protein